MNYTTAVFLINKNARAIRVNYDPESTSTEIVKTLDPTIVVDDFVVVQSSTRHKITTCKVVEVDVDVDLDSGVPMHWIIEKINMESHKMTLVHEVQAISAIKSAELRQKRDNLRDNLLKNHIETIKALPIAAMDGNSEIPPSVVPKA